MWLLEAVSIDPLPTEPFVGVNFWTIIFAWINLFILYMFLKKLLFVPIKNMIDQRQKEIDDMYSDAESSRIAASDMKAEYEEKFNARAMTARLEELYLLEMEKKGKKR